MTSRNCQSSQKEARDRVGDEGGDRTKRARRQSSWGAACATGVPGGSNGAGKEQEKRSNTEVTEDLFHDNTARKRGVNGEGKNAGGGG